MGDTAAPDKGRWPVEYGDQLIIGNPESNVAICCLWTKREQIADQLEPGEYAVVGNLYSRAGLNPMLRNILANPMVRYLVLTGKSFTDSEQALLAFFNEGVGDDWQIVGGHGHVDHDLPRDVIEDVRRNVQLIDLRHSKHLAADLRKAMDQLPVLPPFAEPRTFPKSPPTADVLPSEFAGFVIRQPTIMQAWTEILWTVMNFGHIFPTDYGLEQKEVLGLLSVIENPGSGVESIPDWAPFKAADVEKYVSVFFERDRKEDIAYNYGYRLQSHWPVDQIEALATELARAGHSRRAVASLWDPAADANASEPPCLTTLQAVVREGCLHLMAYIRSNDMFRAYPLNAAALAELQARLVGRLEGVRTGQLMVLSFSAHIYSDCWEAARPAIEEATTSHGRFVEDARGNFVLRIDGTTMIANHFTPEGDLVQTLSAGDTRALRQAVTPFVGRTDHAAYLGQEIERVSSAIEHEGQYVQDEV